MTMEFTFFNTIFVLLMGVSFNACLAQSVGGKVLDGEEIPIVGVMVFLKDVKISETDAEGVFTIADSIVLPVYLELRHPSYLSITVYFEGKDAVFTLSSKPNFQYLEEVNLVGRLRNAGIENGIVSSEKIISQKIEAYSPINLVAAMNETPGVFIHSGALNTNRITIRGVGSRTLYGTNKIRAYFNGIPITNGGGETSIDSYDPENLQALEIIKGPKATKYGTNLGGTLLLTSKQADSGESYFRSNLTVGSFQLIKNSVTAATATEKLSLNLSYEYLETDGFRENSRYNRKNLLLTSKYQFNTNNDLSLLLKFTDAYAQIASSLGKTAFEEDPSQAAFIWKAAQGYEDNNQSLVGLGLNHQFSKGFSNNTSVFYTYLDHYEPRPFNILDEFTNGYGARTVFEANFPLLKKLANLEFGSEYYSDGYNWKTIENRYEENNGNGSLEGELISDNLEIRNTLNVFASLNYPISEKLNMQLGLNFNSTSYNFKDNFNLGGANKSAKRNFEPIFAPNLNLLYRFNENLNAYFNFSRGFNYPSLEETLSPQGLINLNLGPENGYNYEVGSEIYGFKKRLYLKITAYILSIEDLLVAKRVGEDQYIGRNAGKTEHKGIEFQSSYYYPISKALYISPFLNAEFTDHTFIYFVDGEDDYSGNSLTGVADLKINGGINIGLYDFRLHSNFLYVGEMPMNDANTLFSDSFTVFNIKTAYERQVSKSFKVGLNFGINNITDSKYAASILINASSFGNSEPRYYYPGMPRNWYGGINVKYGI